MDSVFRNRSSRASFIKMAAAAGVGVTLADLRLGTARAATTTADTVVSIVSTALIAEQLATTFYYTALTSKPIISSNQLAGTAADPNRPAQMPNGNPGNVRYLQAALDAEIKHAAALSQAGGTSTFTSFYFPSTAFTTLGSPSDPGSFLGVLDALETAFIGAYLAAVSSFVTLGHADLAEFAGEILGVECEHRALGRVIANVNPANNLTLEKTPFTAVGDAATALMPFLTGKGFTGTATAAIPLPTAAMTGPVIGTFSTRLVTMFL